MQHTDETSRQHPEDHTGLIDYLQAVVKRWKMVAGVTAAATLATALYAFSLPDLYSAKTKILPPQQQSGLLSAAMMQGALAAIGGDIMGESKTAKLYVEMLKVESLRDPIIDRLKLQELYHKAYREDVYKELNQRVTVASGKEGIITITVDDEDPKRAAEMANGMVDELKKLTTSMSMSGASNSKSFLDERLASARKDLTEAEDALKVFQNKYKTIDAPQQAALSMSATAQLAAQLTAQEIQLNVLRRTYADTSEAVKAQQQAIGALKDKIARLQSHTGSSSLPGLGDLPDRGQEYLHLMRRFKTAEAVHEMLMKQYEVTRLNAANDVSSIQVIQKALVPVKKSKPVRGLMLIMAFAISLVGALFGTFVLENFARLPEEEKKRWKGLVGGGEKVEGAALRGKAEA